MHGSDDDIMEKEGQGLAITADYVDFSQIIQELSCIDMVFPQCESPGGLYYDFSLKSLITIATLIWILLSV